MSTAIITGVLFGVLFLALSDIIGCEETTEQYDNDYGSSSVSLEALDRGRSRIEQFTARTKLPKYGPCWTDTLKDLKVACKLLDANLQSRLAFAFTSCFVEMTGFPPYMCDKNTPIEKCISNLDDRGYSTFREYFLHTQDMCFYLSNQIWQEETDRTVNQLAFVAAGVTQNMAETKKAQEKILVSQQDALKVQTTIMQDNNALYNAIVRVKQIFDDFRVTADEHQQIFSEIFEQIRKLSSYVEWIRGEMSLFDKVGFYLLAILFGWILTSTKRTISARFWLCILLTTTFFLEIQLTAIWMSVNNNTPLEPEMVQERLWWFRRFSSSIGIIILVITGFKHKDYNVQNNRTLRDMQATLAKIMERVDGNVVASRKPPATRSDPMTCRNKALYNVGTFTDGDFDSDDETYSTDSDSSGYSKDSESSSDTSASIEVEIAERIFLVQDGKTLFPDLDKENCPVDKNIKNIRDEDLPSGPPIQASTPKAIDERSPQRYNLRARKASTSANPVLTTETPKEFNKKIKESYRKSVGLSKKM